MKPAQIGNIFRIKTVGTRILFVELDALKNLLGLNEFARKVRVLSEARSDEVTFGDCCINSNKMLLGNNSR